MSRIESSNQSQRKGHTSPGDAHRPEIAPPPPPPPDESYWAALLHEGDQLPSRGKGTENADWDEEFEFLGQKAESPTGQDRETEDWVVAQRAYQHDQAVELIIVGYNRGGILVEWNSLRGFVPASQLVDFPAVVDGPTRRSELSARVGQRLNLRIIELDSEQKRLILSERAAQVRPGTRATILDTLRRGDLCEGRVTNLCDFGAFVDLGGVEGLIHISELSWGRVGHPHDVLNRGDVVRVYVMEVNRGQGRVALSLKRLQPDPWETVDKRYFIGQIIEGVITNVVDFGAFARVEDGLEGLIHVSELAEGNFLHPRNVVREGDVVRARVLNIDGQSRRLGLSLRSVEDDNVGNQEPENTNGTSWSHFPNL